ncbi:MAG: hypothetical protein M1531_07615 [Chloroflexi bacterium]|nr:hypothetical protein [Chloroflexota bacterium]
MELTIQTGAASGTVELGGLSLARLDIRQGASGLDWQFSQPNRMQMETLHFDGSVGEATLKGLANANASEVFVTASGGEYTLDCGGMLRRDMRVSLAGRAGNFVIVVPPGSAAEVFVRGALKQVETSGGWQRFGNTYTMAGAGPKITFDVDIAAGRLELRGR